MSASAKHNSKKKIPPGRFGPLVKNYEKARRPYPKEVFAYLKRHFANRQPRILDLGCGTGISTRQLATLGTVIGCDPDSIMLRSARRYPKTAHETYKLGSAEKLPFPDSTFDAVTAFASFHWFNNRKALAEIKRVLKPGGTVFVVNRMGTAAWGEGYRKAIMKAIERPVPHFRKTASYNPTRTLTRAGFKKVRDAKWRQSEFYSAPGALEYVQSVSIWNSVPSKLRAKALAGLKRHFEDVRKQHGCIERRLDVKVVMGAKSVR